MANLPIPKIPNLSVTKAKCRDNASCQGTDKKTSISNSEVLIHYGEVEVTMEIKLGYFTDYFTLANGGINPNTKLRAKKIGNAEYQFKYFDPKYLAGSLVQLHDYYAAAEDRIVGLPETKLHRASFKKDGSQGDVRLFKKTPWEFFGCTNMEAVKAGWDFGNLNYNNNVNGGQGFLAAPLYDLAYRSTSPEGEGIRQDYLREAWELVGIWPTSGAKGRLITKERENDLKDYIDSKVANAIDYTNELRILYSLAATGQLPYDAQEKLYRIGNNATNPGFTRKVKIVFNLYFKALRAEMASTTGVTYKELTLEGKPAEQSLNGHRKKRCLKCLVVLNKEDSSENREGVYFFAAVWGKGNPHKSYLEPVRKAEPAHGIGTKKASGKGTIVGYTDAYRLTPADRANLSPEASAQYLLDVSPQRSWVVLEDDLNPWASIVVERIELLRFFKYEQNLAYNWELREANQVQNTPGEDAPGTTYSTRDSKFWKSQGDSRAVRIARPTIQSKGANGLEITSGVTVYFTAGQNITSGDIAGSSMQFHFILPMEAFAVLFDENQYGPTNLVTLPGKFWNMFSMGVFVAKVDFVQATKDTVKIVDTYLKMEAAKEAMRKMKEYLENMRVKFHQHVQELSKAFAEKDLAKYNQILNSLRALAAEFESRVGPNQDLQQSLAQAASAGNQLKIFIDAQNKLQNAPQPSEILNTTTPSTSGPSSTDPIAEGLPVVSPNQVQDSPNSKLPESALVIPIDPKADPIGVNPPNANATTEKPIDPVILNPGIDNPNLGSTHNLGNLGHGFTQVNGDSYQDIPGFDLGIGYDTSFPSWEESGDY